MTIDQEISTFVKHPVNKCPCCIFYLGLIINCKGYVNSFFNRSNLAIVIPIHQENLMVCALAIVNLLALLIAVHISTKWPGTIQDHRNRSLFLIHICGICVHSNSKCSILENTVCETVLPDLEGLNKVFICKWSLAFNCGIQLLSINISRNIHPGINVDPGIFCSDYQRIFSIVTECLANRFQLIIIGRKLQIIFIKVFHVCPYISCIAESQRNCIILAVITFKKRHCVFVIIGSPVIAIFFYQIWSEIFFKVTEFFIHRSCLNSKYSCREINL